MQLKLTEDPSGSDKSAAKDRDFSFDRVLGASSQESAYTACGAPILEKVLQGYNATIFAYGQTGSGKTFTMEGADSTAKDSIAEGGGGAGVIPRLCTNLFTGLAGMGAVAALDVKGGSSQPEPRTPTSSTGVQQSFSITAQYVEIYNERLIDLLTTTPANTTSTAGTGTPVAPGGTPGAEEDGDIRIRQTPAGAIVLEGASARPCVEPADIARLLKEGQGRRTKGETNMNSLSSRSHAVLTLHISITRTEPAADAGGAAVSFTRTCKLSLIDLAGSERAEATGAQGARLKEGAQINLSLTCLGRVINALTSMPEGAISTASAHAAAALATGTTSAAALGKGTVHVPYRDSKLTRLLQDSLGGTAYTCMIACVSPASINYEETLATLRFAQRAKKVTNSARVQVGDSTQARLALLNAEVRTLRARLAIYEGALQRRALPLPISAVVPELAKEEESQSLVGGHALVLAALQQYGSPEAVKAALQPKKKGMCSIV